MLTRLRILLLALIAVAAVAAPTASANPNAPLRDSFEMSDLEIFDLDTTTACGKHVFANVSFRVDRTLYFKSDGSISHLIEAYHGKITWFARGSDSSYTNAITNRIRVDFPEGVDFFKPAVITVTGSHGGVFPIGGGPAGRGTLVYNGFIYTVADPWPYWTTEGPPVSMSGDFETTTWRICKALA